MSRPTPPAPSPDNIRALTATERRLSRSACEARQAEIGAHAAHVATVAGLETLWKQSAGQLDAALGPVFARSDSREDVLFAQHAAAIADALRGVGDLIRAHDDSPAVRESGPAPDGQRPRGIRWRLADLDRPDIRGAMSSAAWVAMQAVRLADYCPEEVEPLLLAEPMSAGWLPAVADLLGPRTGRGRGLVAPKAPRAIPDAPWDTSPMGSDDWHRAAWLLAAVRPPSHIETSSGSAEVDAHTLGTLNCADGLDVVRAPGPSDPPVALWVPRPPTAPPASDVGGAEQIGRVKADGPHEPGEFWWNGQCRYFTDREARLHRLLLIVWPSRRRGASPLVRDVNEDLVSRGGGELELGSLRNYCRDLSAILAGVGVPDRVVVKQCQGQDCVTWRPYD